MLDQISLQAVNGGNRVNYFAVLLVQLRLILARKVAGTPLHVNRSAFIEDCLPWRDFEEQFSFKSGWPSIGMIWESLRERFEREPFYVTGVEVCDHVNAALGTLTLSPDQWAQWVKRAKEQVRRWINDQETWDTLFGWLLEDR